MKFINLTRHTEIGANSYYLEAGGTRLILDCGMHPKDVGEKALPNWKPIDGQTIDAILITHAHQDHVGTLPVLMRRQPHARVFMTEATSEIGSLLLHNSVNVMTRQREELGLTIYPLFGHREIDRAIELWQLCRYRQPYTISDHRIGDDRSEEHTSELQSHVNLVCRLLLEKKKKLSASQSSSLLHLHSVRVIS